MATYKKVSPIDISKETDVVVTLIDGIGTPCAFITDPAQARDTIPIPVEEALADARQMIAADLNPRTIVIAGAGSCRTRSAVQANHPPKRKKPGFRPAFKTAWRSGQLRRRRNRWRAGRPCRRPKA